jgi:peptidoglycan-associated lipoprotein
MRTTLRIVAVLSFASVAALAACSKNKKPPVEIPEDTTTTAPTEPTKTEAPAEPTPVSPNLSLSGDLAKLCNISANSEIPPNFAYDQTELLPEDRKVLEQVATCLTTGPLKGRGVNLVGRADPRGTEEYNMGLGARRAQSVSDYLHKLGVTSPQLAETTRGDLEATGTDEAGWQKDRRVDLELRAE